MTDLEDKQYIRLVKAGNINAFAHLVRRHQDMVFTIIYKVVADRAEAEDITQDVFIKVFESIDKFREDSKFSTWLYRIAYNTTISALRKQEERTISFDDTMLNSSNDNLVDDIDEMTTEASLNYLDEVLQKLPANDAMIITMFYLNNHSIQDISRITGLSESNVKVKLYRIRKVMNFELNKLMKQ